MPNNEPILFLPIRLQRYVWQLVLFWTVAVAITLTCEIWFELTHPDDRDAEEANFNRLVEGSQGGYSLEKRFLTGNECIVWAKVLDGMPAVGKRHDRQHHRGGALDRPLIAPGISRRLLNLSGSCCFFIGGQARHNSVGRRADGIVVCERHRLAGIERVEIGRRQGYM